MGRGCGHGNPGVQAFPSPGANLSLCARERPGGVLLITVRGEVDIAGHHEFRSGLTQPLGGPHRSIVVDLKGCFLDLDGIGILQRAAREARRVGKGFRVVSTSSTLTKVATVALPDLLPLCRSTLETALEDLAAESGFGNHRS